MKKLILSELLLLFLATTFIVDSPTPGWFQQTLPRTDITTQDIFFLDSLKGWVVTRKNTNDSAFIYQTIDGGNTWVTQFAKNVFLTSIQFVDSNTGYSVGGSGRDKIFKTTNEGVLWQDIFPYSFGIYITDLYFVNKDTGWVCDPDVLVGGVLKTTNGGISWGQELGASYLIKKIFFLNKDTGWALSNESNSKLYKTINGGINWNLQFTFLVNPKSIFFTSNDTGYTGGYKTNNGGNNWFAMNNYQGTQVYFVNGLTGWTGGGLSVMQKTVDGQNWFNQIVPAGGYQIVQFVDTIRGWSGGSILIHTTDGGGTTGVHKIGIEIPKSYKLYQNYPNPFNPITKIKYSIKSNMKSEKSIVKIRVFDISGKQIADIVNQNQETGEYEVDFDGSNLTSGIYFYSLYIDGNLIETKRMILLK